MKNEFYGKPKRRDFGFNRFFNDHKSGSNAIYKNGKCVKLGTHQSGKLPIRQFIPKTKTHANASKITIK